MPLPTGVTSVTVTGHYQRGDGSAATGFVSFLPAVPVLDPAGPAILPAVPVTVPLDAAGSFSTPLAATDDTGTSPTGWTYTVVETLDGAVRRSYAIEVPKASAPTVDLASLTPAVPATGVVSYATTAQLAAKVQKSGDTMTGLLILSGDPAVALGAATKQYVDGATTGGPFLPLTGGTLTGALTVPTVRGSTSSAGTLTLSSTSNATKGKVLFGASAAYDEANVRLGIGSTSPSFALDVSSANPQTGQIKRTGTLQTTPVLALLDGDTTSAQALALGVTTDTVNRFAVSAGGIVSWGPGGSTARDLNLYRNAAAELKTDQSLTAGGSLTVGGAQLLAGGVGVMGLRNATTAPGSTPSGGAVLYASGGGLFVKDTGGVAFGLIDGPPASATPTGAIAETIPRWACGSTSNSFTSGTLYPNAIWLQAGQTISAITFVSGGTAGGTLTHWWFALLDRTMLLRGHTADQTSTAFPANSAITKSLVTPYVATYTGLHYVAIMVTATTMPTLTESGISMVNQAVTSNPVAGTSTSGLTTPGTDGSTSYAALAQNSAFAAMYAYVS